MVDAPAENPATVSVGWPDWLRDALRCVYQGGHSADDLVHRIGNGVRAAYGLPGAEQNLSLEPLTERHLRAAEPGEPTPTLCSLHTVRGVNALVDGERLEFAHIGLTIVYGANGSGKSGYARPLKRMCRALLGTNERILGNVFASEVGVSPTATLDVRRGAADPEPVIWTHPEPSPPSLRGVSVFDSAAAAIYIDQLNPVGLAPFDLRVLATLGGLIDRVRAALDSERSQVRSRLSAARPTDGDTNSVWGELALGLDTPIAELATEADIIHATTWSAEDAERLAHLRVRLSSSPSRLAAMDRSELAAIHELESTLRASSERLSQSALDGFNRLLQDLAVAEEAERVARLSISSGAPLPGVGQEAWRALFFAARAYSAVAYPSSEFPVTQNGARCVLCQQPLDTLAADRLRHFDTFIAASTSTTAERLRLEVRGLRDAILALVLPTADALEAVFSRTARLEPSVREATSAYLAAARSRLELLRSELALRPLRALSTNSDLPPLPSFASTRAAVLVALAQNEAARADADTVAHLEADLRALVQREALATRRAELLQRRELLVTLERYRSALAQCSSRRVTEASRPIRRAQTTTRWISGLSQELRLLGLTDLRIEAVDGGEHGTSLLGVRLRATSNDIRVREVLSEGERGALALACFLAELGAVAADGAVILDDPVSSLDHERRVLVAERLVAEARHRQVIVFTHDVAFAFELRSAAALALPPVPVHANRIERGGATNPGLVRSGHGPQIAAGVSDHLSEADAILAELRSRELTVEETQAQRLLFFDRMRRGWERAVEEVLLYDVVTRFAPQVQTTKLRGVTVDDDDFLRVARGMSRCSRFTGHDTPRAGGEWTPGLDVLASEITELRAFVRDVNTRRQAVESRRRRPGEPPTAPAG